MRLLVLAIAPLWIACQRPAPPPGPLDLPADAHRGDAADAPADARPAITWSPADGIPLPIPAVLPCDRATSAQTGDRRNHHEHTLVLLDEHGAPLARVEPRGGDEDQPVSVDLRALARIAFDGPGAFRGTWLRLECEARRPAQLSWACVGDACEPGMVVYADDTLPRGPEPRLSPRCEPETRGDRPLRGCRAALTAEARDLVVDLAALLAAACDRGACVSELEDVRRSVDALAAAAPLRYRSTDRGDALATYSDDDPPDQVPRHTFANGSSTVLVRCETRSSEADDPPPFECRLRLDTPRGPLLFIRAPGEGSGVSYLGRQLWLRDGAVHLSGGAARLR